jgi:hypothetical protein
MTRYRIVGIDNHRRKYQLDELYKIRPGLLNVSRYTADLVLQMKHQLKDEGSMINNADEVIQMAIEVLKATRCKEYLLKYGNMHIAQNPFSKE